MPGLFTALVAPFRKEVAVGAELYGAMDGWGRSAAGVPVNSFTALQHVAVMACVSIVSEDIAKLPILIYKRLANGGKLRIRDHYLADLIKHPNGWQTRFEYMEMMMYALLMRSNAYAVILRDLRGIPLQLIPIHPDRVTLYEAPGGDYFFLVTRQGLHEMAVLQSMPIMIHQEDIFHIRWLSTFNSLLGTSRVDLMRESIGLSMSTEQHTARLMGQGARPGGVLSTDRALTKEVIDRIQKSWQNAYGGYRNAGKTAILEEGLKWTPIEMTAESAQVLESRKFQLEDIARGFRIPRHKLGLPVEGEATGLLQYEQAYINDVISSYCERWIPKLEELGGLDGEDVFVEFDYEHLLKADIKTRLDAKRAGATGLVYTPNEVRRSEGLPDVEGGDVLLAPSGMAPLQSLPGAGGATSAGSDASGKPAPGGAGDAAADNS